MLQKKIYIYIIIINYNIWDVNIDNIVISKLIEAKPNSKYLIGHLDKTVRPAVFILPKMSGYVKTFKVKDKNNKLISFHLNDEKLEKCKTIWTKIEYLKNTELNALPVYDDRYKEIEIKIYGDKVYTNFRGLNMPEGEIESKSFLLILYLHTKTNIIFKYI